MRYRYQLIIDPEFESLVPPLSQEEYSQLEANILRDGCRDPITIWDNVILDGHNRYKICRQHDILFNVNPILIENRDEAISWICSNQMGRRNLTDERRRYTEPLFWFFMARSSAMTIATAPSTFSVLFSLSILMFPAGSVRTKALSMFPRSTG